MPASRRPSFQFSLRTLLVAVVLFAGPLARIAYLHNRAVYHERAAKQYRAIWRAAHPIRDNTPIDEIVGSLGSDDLAKSARHTMLAKQYRDAVYRPWRIVDEGQRLEWPE